MEKRCSQHSERGLLCNFLCGAISFFHISLDGHWLSEDEVFYLVPPIVVIISCRACKLLSMHLELLAQYVIIIKLALSIVLY